jgi:hypothetical protein
MYIDKGYILGTDEEENEGAGDKKRFITTC